LAFLHALPNQDRHGGRQRLRSYELFIPGTEWMTTDLARSSNPSATAYRAISDSGDQ
jgi:hypothetical protein